MSSFILRDITPTRMVVGSLENAGTEVLQVLAFANSGEQRERKLAELYNNAMDSDVRRADFVTLGLLQSVGLVLPLSKYDAYASQQGDVMTTYLLGVLFRATLDCLNEPTARNAINLFNTHQAMRFLDCLKDYRSGMFHRTWKVLFKDRTELAQDIIEDYLDFYNPRIKHPSFGGQTGKKAYAEWHLSFKNRTNVD